MLGKPPPSDLVSDAERLLPRPAEHTPKTLEWASDPLVQQAIGCYLGFGRTLPPEIIDASAAQTIYNLTRTFTPQGVAQLFRSAPMDYYRRALLRAVYHNVQQMRRKNKGVLPWEA